MKTLEDRVGFLICASSATDIFERFSKTALDYGYDQVSFGCATDCPSLGLRKKHGHVSSFNAEWLKHYMDDNLSQVDPVHIYAVNSIVPAYWSQCMQGASPESMQLMHDAADVGLKSGVIVPCAEGAEISMISLARNEKAKDETHNALADINYLGAIFYQGYKKFLKMNAHIELSVREREILTWAAEGKTDAEISMIVNISIPTVRYHWKNIFEKLNVCRRSYAVAIALQLNLIAPCKIVRAKAH